MRQQNPPQAYIDKAIKIESFIDFNSFGKVCAYILVVPSVCLLFAALFIGFEPDHGSMPLRIFLILCVLLCALLWFTLIFLVMFDFVPLKNWIDDLADGWRKPFPLNPIVKTFSPRLKQSDVINVEIAFLYPDRWYTDATQNRFVTAVTAALAKHYSTCSGLPTFDEIQKVIDPPIEKIADELDIPVCYAEVQAQWNERGGAPKERVRIIV